MIINCTECNKKFEINSELIPQSGRLLQCGSCNHKWHFVPDALKPEQEKAEVIYLENTDIEPDETNIRKENIKSPSKNEIDKKKKTQKKKINLLSILIVALISFIALILILDTFKPFISLYIPNLDFVLDNLYETLKDIFLFTQDLFKN